MNWKQEIKKARRGCLIVIKNSTFRELRLVNVKLQSGKLTSGLCYGPVDAWVSSEETGASLQTDAKSSEKTTPEPKKKGDKTKDVSFFVTKFS